MKTCGHCGRRRRFSSFSKRGDGHQAICKDCNRKYQKQYYKDNEQKFKDREIQRRIEKLEWIRSYKEKNGCVDCKQRYPHYLLDLDHVAGKNFSFGRSSLLPSLKRIQEEVKLCDVVCANCHRARTWESGCKGHSPHTCSGHDGALL